jgi:hypothetical protein
VKGHDGSLGNELADKLARKASVQQIEIGNSTMRTLVDIREQAVLALGRRYKKPEAL